MQSSTTGIDPRLLFDQAGTAMIAVDPDSRIIEWNQAAARMFGAGREQMLGTQWQMLIPGHERTGGEQLMLETLRHGITSEFEFTYRNERGDSRRLAAILTSITDREGHRHGGLACIRDITNRVRLLDRLAQQTKMAALGELAGALSHHFNNILGGVVTSVDFALASHDPEIMTSVMEKSATALTRATDLVDNLLAFAEGDFRDAGMSDLGEILASIADETERRLQGANIRFESAIETVRVIPVPTEQMATVLRNLVDNAIESMTTDGGVLTLGLKEEDDRAIISITDTGMGLSEQSISRVFEPFYSTKRDAGDTTSSRGLGLAVAHGIVRVIHGGITVSSAIGRGTTFQVWLPLPGPATSRDAP